MKYEYKIANKLLKDKSKQKFYMNDCISGLGLPHSKIKLCK